MPIDMYKIALVVGCVIVMLFGIGYVHGRLKEKEQGYGPNSLKALGMVLFIPTFLIIAVCLEFETETIAALLGTVAGYVLSQSESVKTENNLNGRNGTQD